uniref:Fibronectin type-III domain-containing protein n=1 Tax=Neogobius melanostomus TaxID=47308 RepID=A0A8C6WZG9_9GOBI
MKERTSILWQKVNKTNSVTLAWQRPPYDGGSKITGYSMERREPGGRWVKANFTNIIETGFTVSGLNQNEAYEFRVYAKNAVGSVSNPSLIAGPVTCVDISGETRYSLHKHTPSLSDRVPPITLCTF